MKFYVQRSFNYNPIKGRPITAKVGDKVSETVYNRLSTRLQGLCIPARQAPRNGDFISQETDLIVRLYVDGVATDDIVSEFYREFPNHVVNGGVECQLRIVAGQDNTTDDKGLENPGRVLRQSMDDIDPERFA